MKSTLKITKWGHFKDSKWSLCTKSRLFEGPKTFLAPFGAKKVGPVRGIEAEGAESEVENQCGLSRRSRCDGGGVRGGDANCSPNPPFHRPNL